jgi:hypothetical protein
MVRDGSGLAKWRQSVPGRASSAVSQERSLPARRARGYSRLKGAVRLPNDSRPRSGQPGSLQWPEMTSVPDEPLTPLLVGEKVRDMLQHG